MNLFGPDVNGDCDTNFDDYRLWFINTFCDEAAELWELFIDDPLFPTDPIIEPFIEPSVMPSIEP